MSALIHTKVFKDLIKIINASFEYMDGCSDEECSDAFSYEHIFSEKLVKRKELSKYFKNVSGVGLMTIGDVSNSTSEHKGGRSIKRKSIKRNAKSIKRNAKSIKRNAKSIKRNAKSIKLSNRHKLRL
jgi:hypothetical protein